MQAVQEKGYIGAGMEGRIARWYAQNTARDMDEFSALADRIAKGLPSGSRILEVAPGPGYLSVEVAKRGQFDMTGLDISRTFVEIASENAKKAAVHIDFRQGNASAMPFDDNSFDVIVCRAAFKNFSQPLEAMNEIYRVLKAGAHALIIDLNKDASMEDINAYIRKTGLGWLNAMIYKITFRYLLIPRAYTKHQISEMASCSRFGRSQIAESGIGLEITLEK